MVTEFVKGLTAQGVPQEQAEGLQAHLNYAQHYVYLEDPGIEDSIASWLIPSLIAHLDTSSAEFLQAVVEHNIPEPSVEYTEHGYDSCQSHRKLSKVASEAILLGGLMYESELLGKPLSLLEAQATVGSTLDLVLAGIDDVSTNLVYVAKHYGGKQDFLFPGVTPSSSDVPALERLAYLALIGTPQTSVRTLTGVGGLRHDQEWNYVVDLPSFVDEKVAEDKRYYRGMGVFYLLMTSSLDSFPAVAQLKAEQREAYDALIVLKSALSSFAHQKFDGVSILASAYLPKWDELKTMQGFTTEQALELAQSFHSPSYEFAGLSVLFEALAKHQPISPVILHEVKSLAKKIGYCWSFNSAIHLPWTAELAGLSNDYMGGRITNLAGDHGARYGVGYKGKSLEVCEFNFGQNRAMPYGLKGKRAYEVKVYTESGQFDGAYTSFMLAPDTSTWRSIQEQGFMKFALHYLEGL